jgi:hypothetical protein
MPSQKPDWQGRDIVIEGVEALEWLATVIEGRMQRSGETQSALLALRDVRGLAGRLVGSEPAEWREGWIRSLLSPEDIRVLDRCEQQAIGIVHSAEDPAPRTSGGHPTRLRRLREFLERYSA